MLFNSLPFIFAFFPITVLVFFAVGNRSHLFACVWMCAASLFFYGWWNPSFLGLLMGSVVFNYAAAYLMSREARNPKRSNARLLLILAVAENLLLLGYFKYAGFFTEIANALFGSKVDLGQIVLPLGISFFTFTQIAFLVDVYQGKTKEPNFVHWLLFVTYFPHLIAGPIIHHARIMPQFAKPETYRINWLNISAGFTVFLIGLGKKIWLADSFGSIATPIFSAVRDGAGPPLAEAWAGALAYTLQLYFDFSGYSDMAIGLSLFFNIKLPFNFNSPYKATNIIDFWRRWHMTLSAFLRDYLYIPLGGNRKGPARRYVNLLATMVLGGLWHGASWTFVAWGALHGTYLMMNHGFRAFFARVGLPQGRFGRLGSLAGAATTFLAVVVAWVFFRADSFSAAGLMLEGMAGGFGLRSAPWIPDGGASTLRIFAVSSLNGRYVGAIVLLGLAVAWLLPNTQEFMRAFDGFDDKVPAPKGIAARIVWEPGRWWTSVLLGILFASLVLKMSPIHVSEFLYYQF
jgi:alginate O-acetyltransferase complex protein AlgI